MRVVVTGGAGFIGSHIAEESVRRGHKTAIIDNLHSGHRKNIPGAIFFNADILNQSVLDDIFEGVDTVFHAAAYISVPESMKHEYKYIENNTIGTLNVLKACRERKVKNVIFSSSASVYGDKGEVRLSEDMTLSPQSPYAITKLSCEHLMNIYRSYGINAVSLRYFNVYGRRQDPNSQYAAAIATFVKQAIDNKDFIIYGSGEQTRDFVNVQDVVDANMLASRSKNALGEVFNIGTGTSISINQLIETISQILGKEGLNPVYADSRPADILESLADISKARRVLGYDPKVTLREGITKFVEWYKRSGGKKLAS